MSLGSLSLNLLKLKDKEENINKLKKKFKVRSKDKVFSTKGIVYDEDFKEYALSDVSLLIKLHSHLKLESPNYYLWEEKLSLIAFQQWERSFEGIEININEVNKKIKEINALRKELLSMLPDLTEGTDSESVCKGWNVPKLVDKWLRDTFSDNILKELEINDKSKLYAFDKEARIKLLALTNNRLIRILIDFKKKDKLWGELKNIRKHSEMVS